MKILVEILSIVAVCGTAQASDSVGGIMAEMTELAGPSTTDATFQLKSDDKLAFIGDSITQAGGYLRVMAYVLKIQYPALNLTNFINAGISSQTSGDMSPRFAASVRLDEKPACVFINAGLNDIFRAGLDKPHDPATLAAFRSNIVHMVEEAQAARVRVVLLTPTIWGEDPGNDPNKRLALYADAMKQIAQEKHCEVVDLHGIFLHALAAEGKSTHITVSDGIHMNALGDMLMAIGVLRALGVPDSKIATTDVTALLNIR